MLIVGSNETAEFLAQGSDTGEDASIERPALQLSKPTLHGVEPRSAGRSEVKVESGMASHELLHVCRLMRAAVVQN